MPKRYQAIKEKFLREGYTLKEAKTRAAKIYNATRRSGEPPLSPKHKSRR